MTLAEKAGIITITFAAGYGFVHLYLGIADMFIEAGVHRLVSYSILAPTSNACILIAVLMVALRLIRYQMTKADRRDKRDKVRQKSRRRYASLLNRKTRYKLDNRGYPQ